MVVIVVVKDHCHLLNQKDLYLYLVVVVVVVMMMEEIKIQGFQVVKEKENQDQDCLEMIVVAVSPVPPHSILLKIHYVH